MQQNPAGSARILVVDDDPVVVQFVRALGRRHLFEVIGASSLAEALERASAYPPDAVLIDLVLGPEESGLDLPQRLRALPGLASVPMAFLSGDDSFASRVAASKAGAAVFLLKPADPEQLASVVHRLVSMGTAPPPQLLIAAAASAAIDEIRASLVQAGMSVALCPHGELLPAMLSEVRPDLLLVDAELPPAGAIDTCRLVRSLPRWHDLYIALMMEPKTDAERSALRAAGADEWLARPVSTVELMDKVSASVNRVRRLRERFDRDPLTGLSLRRAFLEQAGARFEESLLRGNAFSVGLLDLDHFKQVNDSYGHPTGDVVLARLGRLLQTRLRPQDLRARWGGEEFCLAFSGESAATACLFINRLLAEFRSQTIADDKGNSFQVSFSAGVAAVPNDGGSLETLIQRADERLYSAKREGRARVVCC